MSWMTATEGSAGHGPHIPHDAQPGERLRWYPAARRTDRERELRWTCECRLTVYYLVTGGGRAWVRRVHRRHVLDKSPDVVESDHMRYADVGPLWERILLGHAA